MGLHGYCWKLSYITIPNGLGLITPYPWGYMGIVGNRPLAESQRTYSTPPTHGVTWVLLETIRCLCMLRYSHLPYPWGYMGIVGNRNIATIKVFDSFFSLPMGLHGYCWKHLLNHLGFGGVFYGENSEDFWGNLKKVRKKVSENP